MICSGPDAIRHQSWNRSNIQKMYVWYESNLHQFTSLHLVCVQIPGRSHFPNAGGTGWGCMCPTEARHLCLLPSSHQHWISLRREMQLGKVLVGFDYSIITHRCDHHSLDAPSGQTCSQLTFGIQSNPPELSGQSLCWWEIDSPLHRWDIHLRPSPSLQLKECISEAHLDIEMKGDTYP